jgi:hypothetical protein
VKVGTNGWRFENYERIIPYSTWLSMSVSQQAAWTEQTAHLCYAAMTKEDAYESGTPSEFESITEEIIVLAASETAGQVGNDYVFTFVGPMTGTMRNKRRRAI